MSSRRLLAVLALALSVFALAGVAQAEVGEAEAGKARRPQRQLSVISEAAKVERDVVYGKAGDVELKLDLYFPKTRVAEPTPLVIHVHGGGWRNGSKTTGGFLKPVGDEMLRRGYVVASIDYRLLPQVKFPAFIEDCKCAVRYLRANAKKYGIDDDRIGAYGTSAGGHLVSLMGLADKSAGLEGDAGHEDHSSAVRAVVNLFGPNDLTLFKRHTEDADAPFGDMEMRKKASPVTYVDKNDPPFMIIQGDSDRLVPVEQAEVLQKAMDAAGAKSTLVIVAGGGRTQRPRDEAHARRGHQADRRLLRRASARGGKLAPPPRNDFVWTTIPETASSIDNARRCRATRRRSFCRRSPDACRLGSPPRPLRRN